MKHLVCWLRPYPAHHSKYLLSTTKASTSSGPEPKSDPSACCTQEINKMWGNSLLPRNTTGTFRINQPCSEDHLSKKAPLSDLEWINITNVEIELKLKIINKIPKHVRYPLTHPTIPPRTPPSPNMSCILSTTQDDGEAPLSVSESQMGSKADRRRFISPHRSSITGARPKGAALGRATAPEHARSALPPQLGARSHFTLEWWIKRIG